MVINLNSNELCALSLITWQGPFPLFKGVQGIIPDGVRNSVKWKSKIGLQKLAKDIQMRLEIEGIWGTAVFENSMITIIFYEQAVSVMCGKKYIANFYKAEEGLSSITFCEERDMYEIQDYKQESQWLIALCDNCNKLHVDEEMELVISTRDSNGKKIYNTYNIQEERLKAADILKLLERETRRVN